MFAAIVGARPAPGLQVILGTGPPGSTHSVRPCGVSFSSASAPPFAPVAALGDAGLTITRRSTDSPAYVARFAGGVLASDSVSVLLGMMRRAGVPTVLDPEALASLAAFGMTPPEDTPYLHVRRVPPRTRLSFDRRGVCAQAEILAVPSQPAASGDVETLAAAVFSGVQQALEPVLSCRSRVVILLSGGLDSSGVLAAALALGARDKLIAVFLETSGSSADAVHMRTLERSLRLDVLRVSVGDVERSFQGIISPDDLPYASSTVGHDLAVAEALRSTGAEIVLTGVGGDELWGGIAERSLVDLPKAVQGRSGLFTHFRLSLPPLLRSFMPMDLRRRRVQAALPQFWPALGVDRARRLFVDRNLSNARTVRTPAGRASRIVNSEGWRWMADVRGQWEAVSGVPRFDTFADERMVALGTSIPAPILNAFGVPRGLFRLALRGRLPESVRRRRDKGTFDALGREILRRNEGALLPLCTLEALVGLGVVASPHTFHEQFQSFMQRGGSDSQMETVFGLLSLESFVRGRS